LLQEQCASLRATERRRSSQIKILESELATAKSEACEVIPLRKTVDSLRVENRSLRAEILRDFSDRSLLDEENNFEIRRGLQDYSHAKSKSPTACVSTLAFIHINGARHQLIHPKRYPSRGHVINNPNSSPSSNQFGNEDKQQQIDSNECCICFRIAGGAMKSCQCGKSICNKRAHAACIASRKSSKFVSYPGTPSPAMPTILCDGV